MPMRPSCWWQFAETVNVPVVPTLMGWGAIPDDHVLMAGMVGLQTSHRYGNATMLQSDFVLGIGNRWANRHTGSIETYTKGRKFVHVDIEPTQIGRVFNPDFGIVSDAKAALELFVAVAKEWRKAGKLRERQAWPAACQDRKRTMLRKSHFDDMPIKPQRVYEEMSKAFGRDTCYVSVIGLSQIAGAQFLGVYRPRNWINAGQAGPLGWTLPAALGVRAADPSREIVALSGDYDFQFLIEELAVGAQFKLPYIHVVVNNSYLGLIRQAQRGFDMDYHVQLSFENINAPELGVYGVDHVAVAEGLGCKAIRVTDPKDAQAAFATARALMAQHSVPVVVEFILERVTNIAMGTEIDNIVEFEEVLDLPLDDTPVAADLSFENINAPELGVYGVDHVAVAKGLGCKAIRVTDPNHAQAAFATAREWMAEFQVPVVVEFILERVTNIAMGTEIDNIVEFEEVLDLPLDDTPAKAGAPQSGKLLPA